MKLNFISKHTKFYHPQTNFREKVIFSQAPVCLQVYEYTEIYKDASKATFIVHELIYYQLLTLLFVF